MQYCFLFIIFATLEIMKLKVKSPYLLIFSFTAVIITEVISSLISAHSLTTWYQFLHKPSLVPPGFVFGIVWGILYLLMGLSVYLAWRRDKTKSKWAIRTFFLQLILNLFWSIYFFGFQSILLGLVDILLLLASIMWTMVLFYKFSKTAVYLLVPYFLWVCFATYLNYQFLLLNK